MVEPSLADQIATLNSTLRAIEVRLALGRTPVEGLEACKAALDDLRHRLWGLFSFGGDEDRRFQERFRLRRATEMCRGLSGDLRAGSLSGRHHELAGLREAATELSQSIERARRHTP
jgi:hypothetical protein